MRISGILLCVLGVAFLTGCNNTDPKGLHSEFAATSKPAGERKAAPEFSLTDARGISVKLSDLRGKVVLLNFWATWCGPCGLEIPWFIEFEQQLKSRGLEVVGVSMDEDGWKVVKPYIAERKINYRILLGNDSVSQLYGGVDSLPTTFLIDREGRFARPVYVGVAGKNEYQNDIENVLDEKQTASRLFIPGLLTRDLFSLGAAAPAAHH